MEEQTRPRRTRWTIACIVAGVPIVTCLVGTVWGRKRKKRALGDTTDLTSDSADDFTPEQAALLGRVREICDAAKTCQANTLA